MARSLVIVESPAKAKTINKYLGRNYTVKASYGHVMDLPKKTHRYTAARRVGAVRKRGRQAQAEGRRPERRARPSQEAVIKTIAATPEEEFDPTYEVIPSKMKVIGELRESCRRRRERLPGHRP